MNGVSWRPGCPVPLWDLRLIRLRYWGFDRQAHRGRLVVHRDVAEKVAGVFRRLYEVSFPIRRMRLVDYYGAVDRTSMEHDNTSAFNCRWRAGQPGVWSQHAYGRAIDVNPRENPYVWSGGVSPSNGAPYVDPVEPPQGDDLPRRRGLVGVPQPRLGVGRRLVVGEGLPALLAERSLTRIGRRRLSR